MTDHDRASSERASSPDPPGRLGPSAFGSSSLPPDARRLEGSLDRLQEAHFFIHQMEAYYHFAAHFRWHLNAFLRAIKEVPQLVQMALQNAPGFVAWYTPRRDALAADVLMRHLAKRRDRLVHQRMLLPGSKASLGVADYRGMRLGVGVRIDPLVDSDAAMERFVRTTRASTDPFGLLMEDEDTLPCIEREWELAEFPGDNVVDVSARAWINTADLVREVYGWAGVTLEPPGLPCQHESAAVRLRFYPRERLAKDDFRGVALAPAAP